MKSTVYIATSLDGFIARTNGDLDWLIDRNDTPEGEDYGYGTFIDSVDVIVMGRNTFEKGLTFETWPYSGKKVAVLSHSLTEVPAHLAEQVVLLDMAPSELVAHLATQGANHLYVDGGQTIQRFLNAGLIDELIITQIPVLLGEGIPLFGPLEADIQLTHVTTQAFDNGYVQSHYRVAGRAA